MVTNGQLDRLTQQTAVSLSESPPPLMTQTTEQEASERPLRRNLRRTSTSRKRNYCEEEQFSPPTPYEQPYGTKEGVAISTSRLEGAGRGLFGIKPSPHNPLLFKQAKEFVCVYATMEDVITMEEARVSESAYIWTNSKNLQLDWDPTAMYFDAINNRHYGKFANDTWTESGNNCKIIWNPLLRRAEVWTLVDIPLNKELGLAYNDPYWYRLHNGLRTHAQAVQVQQYYNQSTLPPY